jgi:hypothetical protein
MNRIIGAAGMIALLALAGCGKQGALERPAPLFGARAKAQYEAEKAAEAAASHPTGTSSNEQGNGDNAPRTTRDVRDPAQVLRPASQAPVVGAPTGPGGAPPSVSPPN